MKAKDLIEFIDQTTNKIDTFGNRVGAVKEQEKNPLKDPMQEPPKRISMPNRTLSKYYKKKEDNAIKKQGKKKEFLMYPLIKQVPGENG